VAALEAKVADLEPKVVDLEGKLKAAEAKAERAEAAKQRILNGANQAKKKAEDTVAAVNQEVAQLRSENLRLTQVNATAVRGPLVSQCLTWLCRCAGLGAGGREQGDRGEQTAVGAVANHPAAEAAGHRVREPGMNSVKQRYFVVVSWLLSSLFLAE
jgi:hypothetical protein